MEEKMGIIAHQGLKKKKQGLTVLLKLWRHLWVTHLHTVPHQHILLSCLLLRIPLQRCGKDFTIMKVLPSGVYQYRFIVDGQWRYAPDLPWAQDGTGNANNILDLQVNLLSLSWYGIRSFRISNYLFSLNTRDFAKEPPLVPPHVQLPLLNLPASYVSCMLSAFVQSLYCEPKIGGYAISLLLLLALLTMNSIFILKTGCGG
ncbi:SNF1-related protein kinase regulatory subunit beta-2-like [Gossypium hirsutum]|uniref:SNF1-related protein kinase regulatory subunit beta-2-like n=1 Tax=Gossypium hirsutum TaxID=3635 RepID=A0ABM2ZVA4_GOSHI|nr:SNF1-related protein kinase regulatory subunit beta-2-like [Gossypium hirsutum]XP_040946566.1 SNF1-related protein kinase regulatory subunit beta-2-like [Gossypium hirsutum]